MNKLKQTRNVLVAVDAQNDFVNGSLAVDGGEKVIEPINVVTEAVRNSGGQVVFTRDWHPSTTPHFTNWPAHCVAGTEGAEFHADLDVQEQDIVLSKGIGQTDGYSGWEGMSDDGQTLERILEPGSKHEQVVWILAGIATDHCVLATGVAAPQGFKFDERIKKYLLSDGVKAVGRTPTAEADALRELEEAGFQSITSEEAKAMIEGDIS